MKKLYILLVVVLTTISSRAQIVNFTSTSFKNYLLNSNGSSARASSQSPVYDPNHYYLSGAWNVSSYNSIDTNNDGQIQLTEAQSIKYLVLNFSNITVNNLTGLEAFTNLEFIMIIRSYASNINLSNLSSLKGVYMHQNTSSNNLNVSGLTNLETLYCGENQLISVNVSGLIALKEFICNRNRITSLDLSASIFLKSFDCSENLLTNLNVDGLINLEELICSYNVLGNLNINGLISLKELECNNNQINNLNTLSSGLNNLEALYCGSNLLTNLNVTTLLQLKRLNFENNQITNIDVSLLTSLEYLTCNINQLTNLNVSGLSNLKYLLCDNNFITNLDISQLPELTGLSCSGNQLTLLDISELTNLYSLNCNNNLLSMLFMKNNNVFNWISLEFNNNPISYVCADSGDLVLVQNRINSYGYSSTCYVSTYCSFNPGGTFYIIEGEKTFDSNSDGCDANDLIFSNQKFTITNGSISGTIITDQSGTYSIPVESGSHTITPVFENPSYFIVSPASATVSFPATASPATRNFCITANGVKNDLEVTIIPIEVARPGFDAEYKIIYKNKGNQVANGSVSFGFDDAIMDLITATPINDGNATNSLSWNYTNLNPFETREIDLVFNINSPMEIPAVNGDDVLDYTATIVGTTDETPNDNTFTLNQTVVNSYDPNDKTCLEGSTITPSMVGQYVHYVIRFENTGTFAAQNIVVKDMIDTTKFDIATLVPQHSSHDFVTRITNTNKVEFIFENINLPFDDANNDGYVAFKIKTKPTLVLGDTFSNEASIYFDYNFPIITEPATTTVAALSNQDFDFGSYFTLYPNPAKDVLNFEVKNEIGVKSIQVYNTLGQIVLAVTNASTTTSIDVASLNAGAYFIKVVTDKGSANSKFIKE